MNKEEFENNIAGIQAQHGKSVFLIAILRFLYKMVTDKPKQIKK